MKGAHLSVQNVSWSPKQGSKTILKTTTFELDAGRVLGIVGPNGAGKTTLLRLLYRYHQPITGSVLVDGDDIWKLSSRDTAQRIAAVLQEQPSDLALTVEEIVTLGRIPFRRGLGSSNDTDDKEIIDQTLKVLNLRELGKRHLGTLSGGERQRVMFARALAQEPKLLILDEPTNHLDLRHQLEVLELIRNFEITIVASLHDLNLAANICNQILLIESGNTVGFGAARDVLSEQAVSDTFQVQARREKLSASNINHLTFHLKKKRI